MARRQYSIFSHISWIGLAVILCLYISQLQYSALAEKTSNEKNGALTIVESSNDDEENDAVVSIEPNGVENDFEEELHSSDMFKPTKEWQKVKKGQRIPAGLHVRLNLQTGDQEAKLLDDAVNNEPTDEADSDVNQWDAGRNIGIINTEKKRFTRDELKQVVKDFKLNDMDSKQPEDKEDVKKKYRSYDELKQALKDMELAVKTEAEIVTSLVKTLTDPGVKSEDVKTLLVDMEYYLHQIDNARLFCDLDGMNILLRLMNNTEDDIRAKAALALGAALQSNGQVQVNAAEHGVLQALLRILSVDPSSFVKKRSLFALSALLRQFPYAQKKFLTSGGLSALEKLFLSSSEPSLKVKIITLLVDLIQEHDLHAIHNTSGDETKNEKSRQYSEIKIRQAMQANGWCSHLTALLESLTDHDDVEKTLSAMSVVHDVCMNEIASSRSKLKSLSIYYDGLAKEDDDDSDSYFSSIHSSVKTLLRKISLTREGL